MHDLTSSLRSRTDGIQRRTPATPVSEWPIKTLDQLPDHLACLLVSLPPFLTTKRAAELNGGGRSKLYEAAAAGEIRAIKSGATTLWETASILIRLANLPAASISVPTRRPATRPAVSPPPGSRRSRRQPVSAPKGKATSPDLPSSSDASR